MSSVLPELAEDQEMHALILSAMEKLKRISDREYDMLDLDTYRAELEWDSEDDK